MDVRIVVEATFENGTTKIWRLHCLSGPFRGIQPEDLGFLLEEAKSMLWQVQKAILLDQIEEIFEVTRVCYDCSKDRVIHDHRPSATAALQVHVLLNRHATDLFDMKPICELFGLQRSLSRAMGVETAAIPATRACGG